MSTPETRDTRKRPARKPNPEQTALAAFQRAFTPAELHKMTTALLALFWQSEDEHETLDNGEVKVVRRATDPRLRYRIWERLVAYGIGEPTRRVERGKIGELQEYLDQVLGADDAAGKAPAFEEAIAARWAGEDTPAPAPDE